MVRFASLILICLLAACGGDDDSGSSGNSGVDGGKKLTELSASERQDVCDYFVAAQGGVATKDCGNNITVSAPSAAECVSGLETLVASCTATVANAEACADAVEQDLCSLATSPACSFLVQCAVGDAGPF